MSVTQLKTELEAEFGPDFIELMEHFTTWIKQVRLCQRDLLKRENDPVAPSEVLEHLRLKVLGALYRRDPSVYGGYSADTYPEIGELAAFYESAAAEYCCNPAFYIMRKSRIGDVLTCIQSGDELLEPDEATLYDMIAIETACKD